MIIQGVVSRGRCLGRELGFPTANITIPEGVSLTSGVYRSRVGVGGVEYDAITNIGENPTVGNTSRRVESHIFNFEGDIYGQTITVELVEFIRKERKFESLEQLRAQIERDVNHLKNHLVH